jgi:hypothetical protein
MSTKETKMNSQGPTIARVCRHGLSLCLALGFLTACASSDVESRREYEGELTEPNLIVVYDFSATPQDVPPTSALYGLVERREVPQTAEEVELGRLLGARVAEKLVVDLNERGIPAARAAGGAMPRVGDAAIKGAFVALDEGHQLKRVLIGFGAGAAELGSVVEAFQMREDGLHPLGSGEVVSGGGQMPGVLVPVGAGAAAGTAATSAVISGSVNVVKEAGPESIEGAADRTASEVADTIEAVYKKRGWR